MGKGKTFDFNSIKVQLKRGGGRAARASPPVFQFHKGTIKARLRLPWGFLAWAISIP